MFFISDIFCTEYEFLFEGVENIFEHLKFVFVFGLLDVDIAALFVLFHNSV